MTTATTATALSTDSPVPRRAYSLRYDRMAGVVTLLSAAVWLLLLIHTAVSNSRLTIEVILRAAGLVPAALILMPMVAIDVALGVALLRDAPRSRFVLFVRAMLGIALCVAYFAISHDFETAFLLGIVQGLILACLTRETGTLLVYPSMVWVGIFFLLPLLSVVAFSLGRNTTLGTVDLSAPNLNNYARILSPVGVSGLVYLTIIIRSIWLAFLNTVVCLLVGYPFSYWLARRPEKIRNALLLAVMIPFWTNLLIRTYAWLIILRQDGLLNNFLVNVLGVIDKPLELVNTPGALLLGMVYGYLPYMILPLYSSIERLDGRLLEAASDLYGAPGQVFRRIILPLTAPGIVAGSILVFIPSVGSYVVSNVLGGGKFFLIGNLLEQQFLGSGGNRAFGAAFGVVLTGLMLIATLIYFRLGRGDGYK